LSQNDYNATPLNDLLNCMNIGQWAETIHDNGFAYRIMQDGTAHFEWFWNSFDDSHYDSSTIEIPESVQGHRVVRVLSHAFQEFNKIRTVILPNSITTLEDNPFEGCPNLEEIIVSEDHPSLMVADGLLISKREKKVICCPQAKKGRISAIPDWVTAIGSNAFSGCEKITSISLPDSIETIMDGSFFRCSSLEEIKLPPKIGYISDHVFSQCSSLKNVVLPEKITRIGDMSFAECSSLNAIHLPDSIESFGCYSFLFCENLEEINLPLNLKEIDLPAFLHCEKLTNIIVPAEQKTYRVEGSFLIDQIQDELVSYLPSFRDNRLSFPTGLTRIGAFAFEGIDCIREINVPEGIKSIGESAFSGCKELRYVHLPQSLERLEEFVFGGCHKLKKIWLPKSIIDFASDSIYQTGYLKAVVDKGSAARDYCLKKGIPYHYKKRSRKNRRHF